MRGDIRSRSFLLKWMLLLCVLLMASCSEDTKSYDAGPTDLATDHGQETGKQDSSNLDQSSPDTGAPSSGVTNLGWTTTPGSFLSLSALAVDKAGDVCVAGAFRGSALLGGVKITSKTNLNFDYVVAKLSPAGKALWIDRIAGGSAGDVVADAAGNFLVAGTHSGALVTKYDPKGKVLWQTTASGYSGAMALALGNNGAVYVAGLFAQTSTFGGTTLKSAGSTDVFVGKLTTKGTWVWAVRAGGKGRDLGTGIAVDAQDRSHIVGRMGSEATFGSTSLKGHKDRSVFVTRVDPLGTFTWAVSAATGGTQYEASENRIAVDASGNSTVSALLHNPGSFGPLTLKYQGKEDGFVARLDPTGTFVWGHVLGGKGGDSFYAVDVDASSNTYVGGSFQGSFSLGTKTLTAKSPKVDVLLARLGPKGAVTKTLRAWGTGWADVIDLAVAKGGTVHVMGSLNGDVQFQKHKLSSNGTAAKYWWRIAPGAW